MALFVIVGMESRMYTVGLKVIEFFFIAVWNISQSVVWKSTYLLDMCSIYVHVGLKISRPVL